MAPNPVIIPRSQSYQYPRAARTQQQKIALIAVLSLLILVVSFFTKNSAVRKWVLSGAAVESLLLVYGSLTGSFFQHDFYLWLATALLNLTFAVSSTSWLLRPIFLAACWLTVLPTCSFVFPILPYFIRRWLRSFLHEIHLFRDKMAFFNLPALRIDTEANGLFAVRGITVSLSDLSIVAHGLELGLRLNKKVELAVCSDRITIKLFRHIDIADVYGNLKFEEREMFFKDPAELQADESRLGDTKTPSITESSHHHQADDEYGQRNMPKVPHNSNFNAKGHSLNGTRIPTNELEAERRYEQVLKQITESSQIFIARKEIEQDDTRPLPDDEKKMRQAVCAKLQDVPSVSHTPPVAVKVSVLQTIFPRTRKFLHRLPMLLRLVLNPLSHFHPIRVSSISIAGPGERIRNVLEEHMFHDEALQDADVQQLQHEMSEWLDAASFCLEVSDLAGLGHVPITSTGEIVTYLRSADISIYRTPRDSHTVTQVSHLGGADGTCVLPAFLLPHHEHCLPVPPSGEGVGDRRISKQTLNSNENLADDGTQDETRLWISVHASLPTTFDQSLLDFAASMLKATKLLDLENLFEQESSSASTASEPSNTQKNDHGGEEEGSRTDTKSSTSNSIAPSGSTRKAMIDSLKKGLKMDAVRDKVNDRWVARTVGKIAARLEEAQGDFGYTTTVPMSLRPYRLAAESPSKILP